MCNKNRISLTLSGFRCHHRAPGISFSKGRFILILSKICRRVEPRLGPGRGKEVALGDAALGDSAPRWSHRASEPLTEGQGAPKGVELSQARGALKTASH